MLLLEDMNLYDLCQSLFMFVGIATSLLVTYEFITVVYNVFFSPLAKYPGPFLAKVTNGYAAYHAFKGDLHLDVLRCHEKYGKIVRYGPNKVLVNTIEGFQDIYGIGKNVRKSKGYDAFQQHAEDKNIISAIDKQEHNQKRRVIVRAFAEDSVKRNYEPSVLKLVRAFCDILPADGNTSDEFEHHSLESGEWSSPKNMSDWTGYLSADIMAKLVFGADLQTLTSVKYRSLTSLIAGAFTLVSILIEAIEMVAWRLDRIIVPSAENARKGFRLVVRDLLQQRIAASNGASQVDIFQSWLDARDPKTGRGLGPRQLASESGVLIVAGSHTVETALSGLFFYLSRNPVAYARVAGEVRMTFSTQEQIVTGPLLDSCIYLRACLDEVLRKAPPVAVPLWRDIQDGGELIDGRFFPAGTTVAVALYALHHNPEYFPKPAVFNPERWLCGGADEELARKAHAPFSIGPRTCMGKGIALVEILLTMAHVLWALDFKSAEGPEGRIGEERREGYGGETGEDAEFELHSHFISVTDGPVIQFKRRS